MIRTAADRLGGLTGGASRIGFEPAQLTVERHGILAEAHEGLVPVAGLVERLRVVKDADELAAVRASAALIEPVYTQIAAEGLERPKRDRRRLARAGAVPPRAAPTASRSRRSWPRTSAARSRTRIRATT